MEKDNELALVTFSFYPTDHEFWHDTYLSFSVHNDMRLEELHRLCKKFALALGFSQEGVEEIFGGNWD